MTFEEGLPAFFALTNGTLYNDRDLFDFQFVKWDFANSTLELKVETVDALPCIDMLAKYVQDEETRNDMN